MVIFLENNWNPLIFSSIMRMSSSIFKNSHSPFLFWLASLNSKRKTFCQSLRNSDCSNKHVISIIFLMAVDLLLWKNINRTYGILILIAICHPIIDFSHKLLRYRKKLNFLRPIIYPDLLIQFQAIDWSIVRHIMIWYNRCIVMIIIIQSTKYLYLSRNLVVNCRTSSINNDFVKYCKFS